MKIVYSAAVAAGLLTAALAPERAHADGKAADVAVKFCPVEQVRTYPLESQRGVQSLLLQNVLVTHGGAGAIEVVGVDIELMAGGEVKDARRIAGADLKAAAAAGPHVQGSGMMNMMAFQFCSGELIPAGAKLTGPSLKANEAMLLMQQPFAYKGARDSVRVCVQFLRDGKMVETRASLPINSGMSKTAFRFPMTGQWFAAVGPTPHTAHRWALPEEFAFDIVRLGDGTRSFRGDGTKFEDYFAYGADILAAADGKVVAVKTDVAEDPATLRQPGEAADAYGEALKLGPDDPYVRHLVAAAGILPGTARASEEYVRTVFDGYASRFETHLVSLGYRVPGLLRAALQRHLPGSAWLPRMLDLGCGTGLMGVVLSDTANDGLVGVDLSARMLEQARGKNLYSALHEADILTFLRDTADSYPVILAADVLCYFGDLSDVLTAVSLRLLPGGLFMCSLEELTDAHEGGWRLGRQGRYSHNVDDVLARFAAAGLHVREMSRETLRQEGGTDVPGMILVAERRA